MQWFLKFSKVALTILSCFLYVLIYFMRVFLHSWTRMWTTCMWRSEDTLDSSVLSSQARPRGWTRVTPQPWQQAPLPAEPSRQPLVHYSLNTGAQGWFLTLFISKEKGQWFRQIHELTHIKICRESFFSMSKSNPGHVLSRVHQPDSLPWVSCE